MDIDSVMSMWYKVEAMGKIVQGKLHKNMRLIHMHKIVINVFLSQRFLLFLLNGASQHVHFLLVQHVEIFSMIDTSIDLIKWNVID